MRALFSGLTLGTLTMRNYSFVYLGLNLLDVLEVKHHIMR